MMVLSWSNLEITPKISYSDWESTFRKILDKYLQLNRDAECRPQTFGNSSSAKDNYEKILFEKQVS